MGPTGRAVGLDMTSEMVERARGNAVAGLGNVEVRRNAMKVLFVLFRRADLSHEQALAEWSGPRHTAIVRELPGLKKWVQNHVVEVPHERAADGIGELWFGGADAMEQAMNSPQMAAAVEDAKRFLDMERTYALVVHEKTVIGEGSGMA